MSDNEYPEPDMKAHLPYLEAVTDALQAAGLDAGRVEDSSDEWRAGLISIATGTDDDPDDGDGDFMLCWDWRHGWFSGWHSRDGIRYIEYYTGPVTADPAEIAAAASARLDGNRGEWTMNQPGWNHDPDDDGYDKDFAAGLERDLAEFRAS